jgi:hypothetical protein
MRLHVSLTAICAMTASDILVAAVNAPVHAGPNVCHQNYIKCLETKSHLKKTSKFTLCHAVPQCRAKCEKNKLYCGAGGGDDSSRKKKVYPR